MPSVRRPAAGVGAQVAALATGAWLLWRAAPPGAGAPVRPVPPDDADEGARSLAVVVPARDEAATLPRLLRSLATQTRPPDEVIVVDDHSTDATAAIARAAGATVLSAPALPAGWLGKPWACHQGAGASRAAILLFLDADVVLGPEAVARLEVEYLGGGGLVSVQPSHEPGRWHEQLSAVCNVVTMMGTGGFTGAPRGPMAMAFGPCLLVGRDAYERAGGHAHPTVRDQVCEDAALARRVRATGGAVRGFAGGALIRFRMYPGGPRQMVDGWSKMLAGGGRRAPKVPALLTAFWVTGALLGAGRGPAAVAPGRRGARRRARDAALYAAWVAEMRWLFGRVGRWHPVTAWAFPAPLLVFVALSARSTALALSGRSIAWRGRPVPAR